MVMLYNSDDMVIMTITWLAMYIAAAATEMGDLPAAMSRSDACSKNQMLVVNWNATKYSHPNVQDSANF